MTQTADPMHDHHDHVAPEPGPDDIVLVSCVRHSYEDGASVHLCGLDFVAKRGQRVAVLGPNGAGKTTMLYHILGLMRAQEGVVRVFGLDPSAHWPEIRKRIGVVLQNVDEQLLAPTVGDDVAFSPRQYGLTEDEIATRVTEALAALDIENLRDRVPHNLSGGEKRKVAMAGALVMQPDLLVLDEPFEGLDPASRQKMGELLARLARDGTTIVMSTHDIDSVPDMADYAYVMAPGGQIALSGTPAEVFSAADILAAGNIKPPVLAELFLRLRESAADAPEPALDVESAARALLGWHRAD